MGCVTYEPPPATPVSDPTLVGIYEARYRQNGVPVVHEYVLFPDGYFQETITYEDEAEPYYDYGVYSYSIDDASIAFFFIDPDSRQYNFVGHRDSDGDSFSDQSDDFNRTGSQDDVLSFAVADEAIAGAYLLSYEQDGDDVYLVMIIGADGSFTEWSVYMDDQDAFSDTGQYTRAGVSGVTRFAYDDWPDGNFVGRLDGSSLYSIEGLYSRIESEDDADIRNLPSLVRNVLP